MIIRNIKHRDIDGSIQQLQTFLLPHIEVAGGTDIVKKTMQAFCVPTSKAMALIDLHAYDGFSALAALEVAWLFGLPALVPNANNNILTIKNIIYNLIQDDIMYL